MPRCDDSSPDRDAAPGSVVWDIDTGAGTAGRRNYDYGPLRLHSIDMVVFALGGE